MHITRSRMVRDLRAHDYHGRFRIFYPVDAAGQGIYVHAKISIIDDTLLRVGSSNIDRRSMGFDTECDVALAGTKGASRRMIAAMRDRLLAEHLDTTPEAVAAAVKAHGSLISAIEALNPRTGRSLRELPLRRESFLGRLLADTRFFDPRYRASAKARVGVTSRHLMIGAGLLAGGALIWRQFRRKDRPGKD